MSKGELTRTRILDEAMRLASRYGLDGVTIGLLSETLALSKSGLFAHFGSKEALQLAVLQHTREQFAARLQERLDGALPGLPTLDAYVNVWLDWIASPDLPAGCPILGAAFEMEAREGPVRDILISVQKGARERLSAMVRGAVEAGHLSADTDVDQLIFHLRGIALAFHEDHHMLRTSSAREQAQRAYRDLLEWYGKASQRKPATSKPKRGRGGRETRATPSSRHPLSGSRARRR